MYIRENIAQIIEFMYLHPWMFSFLIVPILFMIGYLLVEIINFHKQAKAEGGNGAEQKDKRGYRQ